MTDRQTGDDHRQPTKGFRLASSPTDSDRAIERGYLDE